MKSVASYISLFSIRKRGQLSGILASYVDDTLSCVDNAFAELTKKTREAFDVKKREYGNIRFHGAYIDRHADGSHIHQRAYINRLEQLPRDADFTLFGQVRAKPFCLVHTRPEICIVSNKLAQLTEETFDRSHVKEFNSAVRHLLSTCDLSLNMRKLNVDSLHILAYSNVSFATNRDYTSQLGYIVLLADKHDNACKLILANSFVETGASRF